LFGVFCPGMTFAANSTIILLAAFRVGVNLLSVFHQNLSLLPKAWQQSHSKTFFNTCLSSKE
jgi:hypothetical protein